jgi:hypothetical protein
MSESIVSEMEISKGVLLLLSRTFTLVFWARRSFAVAPYAQYNGCSGANMPCAQYVIGICGSRSRRIKVLAISTNSGWKLYSLVRATNTVGKRMLERA